MHCACAVFRQQLAFILAYCFRILLSELSKSCNLDVNCSSDAVPTCCCISNLPAELAREGRGRVRANVIARDVFSVNRFPTSPYPAGW